MKKLLVATLVGFCLLGITSEARAGLIGDSILLEHIFNGYAIDSGTVTPVTNFTDFAWYNAFIDNDSVTIQDQLGVYWADSSFNGLSISGIDTYINNVSINTNLAGWDDSRLSYTEDSLAFNWADLNFANEFYFEAYIDFDETQNNGNGNEGGTNSVPEPATLFLFTSGLAGVYLRKKRT